MGFFPDSLPRSVVTIRPKWTYCRMFQVLGDWTLRSPGGVTRVRKWVRREGTLPRVSPSPPDIRKGKASEAETTEVRDLSEFPFPPDHTWGSCHVGGVCFFATLTGGVSRVWNEEEWPVSENWTLRSYWWCGGWTSGFSLHRVVKRLLL